MARAMIGKAITRALYHLGALSKASTFTLQLICMTVDRRADIFKLLAHRIRVEIEAALECRSNADHFGEEYIIHVWIRTSL